MNKHQFNADEDAKDPHDDMILRSEHNIQAQSLFSFKEMLSNTSSKYLNYNQTIQSAASMSIQNELNQYRLKFKSNSQLKLNHYKDSLEKKITQLKEKIANTYQTTQSLSSPIQPNQLSNYYTLLKHNTSLCLKLLEFLTPNDLYHFLRIKELHSLIIASIREVVNKRFKLQYNTKYFHIFNKNKFNLCIRHYKKNKKVNSEMYISISSLISINDTVYSDYINKTIYLKYINECFSYKNKTSNVFALDIYPKNSINNYWIFKEHTSFHYDDFEKAYYPNLIAFNEGDTLKVSTNVFSENGFINLNTFHWCKLVLKPTLKSNWLMSSISLTKEHNSFPLRYCEAEELRNEWKHIDQMDNAQSFIQSIQLKFNDHFSIGDIFYDDVGYYLFRVSLTAKSKGKVEASKDLGITIEIFEQSESIGNYIKKNDLIIEEKNELNMRIGDLLVFYLSHKK